MNYYDRIFELQTGAWQVCAFGPGAQFLHGPTFDVRLIAGIKF